MPDSKKKQENRQRSVPIARDPGLFGTFGNRSAEESENQLVGVVALMLDHLAFELDQHHDDTQLFVALEGADSAFVAFRRGLAVVRHHGGWVSERAEYLESRLKDTVRENGMQDLPPLPDDDGNPFGWLIFQAQRDKDGG